MTQAIMLRPFRSRADIPEMPFTAEYVASIFPHRVSKWGPDIKVDAVVFTQVLNALARTGAYYKSCAAVGISYPTFMRLRKEYKEVAALVEEAMETYRQRIALTIHDRAIEGWDEPVFYQGVEVGQIHRFSDSLLMMQAKRHMPEYREHTTTDLNVAGGVLVVHASEMTKEDWLAKYGQKHVDSQVVEKEEKS